MNRQSITLWSTAIISGALLFSCSKDDCACGSDGEGAAGSNGTAGAAGASSLEAEAQNVGAAAAEAFSDLVPGVDGGRFLVSSGGKSLNMGPNPIAVRRGSVFISSSFPEGVFDTPSWAYVGLPLRAVTDMLDGADIAMIKSELGSYPVEVGILVTRDQLEYLGMEVPIDYAPGYITHFHLDSNIRDLNFSLDGRLKGTVEFTSSAAYYIDVIRNRNEGALPEISFKLEFDFPLDDLLPAAIKSAPVAELSFDAESSWGYYSEEDL